MKFIEVPILCHTNFSSELEKLGIKPDSNDKAYEVRMGKIRVDSVYAYYPSDEIDECYVNVQGDNFNLKISYEEFNKLIDQHV